MLIVVSNRKSEVMRVSKEFGNYVRDVMRRYDIKKTSEATNFHLKKTCGNYNEIFKI